MQKLYHNGFEVSAALKQSGSYVDVAWPVYTSSIDVEYLVIGGGGGGAAEDDQYNDGPGGGGGAGAVKSGSFSFATGSTDLPLRVGFGGGGGRYPNRSVLGGGDGDGDNGDSSYISGVVTAQSGSQGKSVHGGTPTSPIGGKSGTPFDGGNGSTNDKAGGGGGGSTSPGTSGADDTTTNAIGGTGGEGLNITTWYVDESTPLGLVAGGGGGGAGGLTNNSGGAGNYGGGDGGDDVQLPTNATTFGSGGGGGYRTDAGSGKSGIILLRYKNILPINDSGELIYKVGDYWYHKFINASYGTRPFKRPERILIDI
jgi:hypothetical protein